MSKKTKDEPSTKTINKNKDKVIEDLTFGLKNKNKSKVVQQYVKEVTAKVQFSNVKGGQRAVEDANRAKKEEKSKKDEMNSLIASLFKAVTDVTVNDAGEVDYKLTLCPYFKAGVCEKGKRCKYSHDMSVAEAKTANIDIYQDPRAKIGKMPVDTIITCNHFITAVESELYGFNWVCPNGGDLCQYRHMLPQGYVLQKDLGPVDPRDADDEMTLEEKIEEERALLKHDECTPVTKASFEKWKADKAARLQKELFEKAATEVAKGKKGGKEFGFMSGRALFTYDPTLFADDDDAVAEELYDEDAGDEQMTEETKQGSLRDGHGYIEESKEEVKIDEELFQEADADEEVDFD